MVIIRHLTLPLVGIRFQDASVEALLGDEVLGKGTLYVTEEQIMWLKESGNEGFTIQYKKMTLHAISRDPNVHPRNCLYVMINGTLDAGGDEPQEAPQENDNGEEDETTEIRFIPEDSSRLDLLYKSIQDCTLLHPDPSSDMSESSEDNDDDEGEDEDANMGLLGVMRGPPVPQYGMGGGRIIPSLRDDHEFERQFGAMQAHFGPRLIFGHDNNRPLGAPPGSSSNGNGHHHHHHGASSSRGNNGNPSPRRDISPEEQFQNLEEDEDQ